MLVSVVSLYFYTGFIFIVSLLQRHKVYVYLWETCFTEDIFFSYFSSYFTLFVNLSLRSKTVFYLK